MRGRYGAVHARVRPADPGPGTAQAVRPGSAAPAARARFAAAGADPDGGRFDRAARQRPRPGRRRLHGQAVRPVRAGSAGARPHPPRCRRRRHRHQARPAHVRPGGPQRPHQRPDAGPVRARAGPAGNPVGPHRPPGLQGAAGRPPVRMGRGSEQQRHRSVCAPLAQEDRGGRRAHRHRARPRLQPGKIHRRRQGRGNRGRRQVNPEAADDTPDYQPPAVEPDESMQRSLFGEILDWMLAPLLLLWPMSIAITYLVAKSIANQPFDHALEDSVTVLAQQVRSVDGKLVKGLSGSARDILRADDRTLSQRQYARHAGARGLHSHPPRPQRRRHRRLRAIAAGADPGGRDAGQARPPGQRDHQGRDPAAVHHPAHRAGPGMVCAVARPETAGAAAGAHPRAQLGRPQPHCLEPGARGNLAAGALAQRDAGPAVANHRHAETLHCRRRPPDAHPAGRHAHAVRTGAAPDRPRRNPPLARATGQELADGHPAGEPAAGPGPRGKPAANRHRPAAAGIVGPGPQRRARLGAGIVHPEYRPRLRRTAGAGADRGRPHHVARADLEPDRQRAALHPRRRQRDRARADRRRRPCAAGGGRHGARHSPGRARARVRTFLPHSRQYRRRQRPGPGHRARNRPPAWRRGRRIQQPARAAGQISGQPVPADLPAAACAGRPRRKRTTVLWIKPFAAITGTTPAA
uniref:Two-component sensor kinase N-terminal domain-containing protein n=1 Tax=Tanacetum cinerariifolium TaxID=118510 RepID=A0A699GDT0_TANCI|nr:hypothetical protein [Tanacetum cinerariifolium]